MQHCALYLPGQPPPAHSTRARQHAPRLGRLRSLSRSGGVRATRAGQRMPRRAREGRCTRAGRAANLGAARLVRRGLLRGAAARHEVERVVAAIVGADGRRGRGRAGERVRLRGGDREPNQATDTFF